MVYRLYSGFGLHLVLYDHIRFDDLEANLHYPTGSSFDTIVKDLLGKGWNIINGLSVAFVLYILTYAYITSGGGITQNFAQSSLWFR